MSVTQGAGHMRYPPFAGPGTADVQSVPGDGREELPSIDEFLDELPSIQDFIAFEPMVDTDPYRAEEPETRPGSVLPEFDSQGWAISGWQSYDWSSLASIGVPSADPTSAEQDWSSTEWGATAAMPTFEPMAAAPVMPQGVAPTADEVATALDAIARRIRSGELVIDKMHGTPPEAAMAAALAVLLRRG